MTPAAPQRAPCSQANGAPRHDFVAADLVHHVRAPPFLLICPQYSTHGRVCQATIPFLSAPASGRLLSGVGKNRNIFPYRRSLRGTKRRYRSRCSEATYGFLCIAANPSPLGCLRRGTFCHQRQKVPKKRRQNPWFWNPFRCKKVSFDRIKTCMRLRHTSAAAPGRVKQGAGKDLNDFDTTRSIVYKIVYTLKKQERWSAPVFIYLMEIR